MAVGPDDNEQAVKKDSQSVKDFEIMEYFVSLG